MSKRLQQSKRELDTQRHYKYNLAFRCFTGVIQKLWIVGWIIVICHIQSQS